MAGVECSVSRDRWRTFPISIGLDAELDLAAILCHVEERVIGNDYTFSFAGRRYQIAREQSQAGMRRQRLRVELRLDGELKARYQGRYLNIAECGARVAAPEPRSRKPVAQGSQRGRQEHLDAGLLRPSQSSAVEADRRVNVKPFGSRAILR